MNAEGTGRLLVSHIEFVDQTLQAKNRLRRYLLKLKSYTVAAVIGVLFTAQPVHGERRALPLAIAGREFEIDG